MNLLINDADGLNQDLCWCEDNWSELVCKFLFVLFLLGEVNHMQTFWLAFVFGVPGSNCLCVSQGSWKSWAQPIAPPIIVVMKQSLGSGVCYRTMPCSVCVLGCHIPCGFCMALRCVRVMVAWSRPWDASKLSLSEDCDEHGFFVGRGWWWCVVWAVTCLLVVVWCLVGWGWWWLWTMDSVELLSEDGDEYNLMLDAERQMMMLCLHWNMFSRSPTSRSTACLIFAIILILGWLW